jgi:hypothetical protein
MLSFGPHILGAPEFTPLFSGVRVTRSLVVCVCFVDCPFVLFILAIVLSVLKVSIYSNNLLLYTVEISKIGSSV